MSTRDTRRVKVEIWVETRDEAEAVIEAVEDAENAEMIEGYDATIYENYEAA